jgi:hypothetical protein
LIERLHDNIDPQAEELQFVFHDKAIYARREQAGDEIERETSDCQRELGVIYARNSA